jgi:hypothetical protein
MMRDKNTATLVDGLSILSQSRRQTGDIWQAYYGAAAIAGYFFIKENHLSGKVEEAVAAENRGMIGKYLQPGTVPVFYHHWNRVSEAPAKAMENFRYIIHPVQTVIS